MALAAIGIGLQAAGLLTSASARRTERKARQLQRQQVRLSNARARLQAARQAFIASGEQAAANTGEQGSAAQAGQRQAQQQFSGNLAFASEADKIGMQAAGQLDAATRLAGVTSGLFAAGRLATKSARLFAGREEFPDVPSFSAEVGSPAASTVSIPAPGVNTVGNTIQPGHSGQARVIGAEVGNIIPTGTPPSQLFTGIQSLFDSAP